MGGAPTSRVFVGNMPWSIDTDDKFLQVLTDAQVPAKSCKVIMDRETGRPRGFGFVELQSPDAATGAIAALNGFYVDGRPLRADYAEQRDQGRGGGGGRGHGGGGGGGGGYGGGGDRGGDRGGRGGRDDRRGGRGGDW